jgi:hypothetical protein
MASLFALNATLPPTVRGTAAVPVVGLANPTVTESGAVVWRDGAFVPGVEGVTGAARAGGYVVFDIGSGDFAFATSAASGPVLVSACAAAAAPGDGAPALALACPADARLSHIVRAGVVGAAAVDAGFGSPGAAGATRASVPGAVQHRFLLTHVLERLCLGRGACAPSWRELEEAARPAGAALEAARGEADANLCVVAACE